MSAYEIDVSWMVCGTVSIEANNIEHAIAQARGYNPCSVGNAIYVGDSWLVNDDATRENNKDSD